MIYQKRNSYYNIENLQKKAHIGFDEDAAIKRTTLFKYKLMRIRSKISYSAFEKNMTIPELFFNQIQTSFQHFVKLGEIKLSTK